MINKKKAEEELKSFLFETDANSDEKTINSDKEGVLNYQREWFVKAETSEKVNFLFKHVLNVTPIPLWYISCQLKKTEALPLMCCFLDPLNVKVLDCGIATRIALSYEQFNILHELLRCTKTIITPMRSCYSEYWYLYSLCTTVPATKFIDAVERGQQLTYNSFQYTLPTEGSILSFTPDSLKNLFENVSSKASFIQCVGKSSYPRFSIRTFKALISKELYEAWPVYWETLTLDKSNIFAAMVSRALDFMRNPRIIKRIISRDAVIIEKEHVSVLRSAGLLPGDALANTFVVDIPRPMIPIMDETVYKELPAVSCPERSCCDSPSLARYREEITGEAWQICLTEFDYGVALAKAHEWEVKGFDVNDESNRSLKMDMQVPWDSASSEVVSYFENNRDKVYVDQQIWQQYLGVDAWVAKHVLLDFYDKDPSYPVPMKIDVEKLRAKLGKRKLPRTFYKFAWLYSEHGYITSYLDGSPAVGQLPISSARVLEISGAPWGCMMVTLETGMARQYHFTRFAAEASTDPPYLGDGAQDFLQGQEVSTDISSIVKTVFADHVNAGFLEKNMTGFDWSSKLNQSLKYGQLVLDLSLHRNSGMARDKHYWKDLKKNTMNVEFVDDAPLGRAEMMARHLRDYILLRNLLLQKQGSMVVKIFEPWDHNVSRLLYDLVAPFRSVFFYRNKFSRLLSKEFYVILDGYDCGFQMHDHFYTNLLQFNSIALSLLTLNLASVAALYGSDYKTEMKIICRARLYELHAPYVNKKIVNLQTFGYKPNATICIPNQRDPAMLVSEQNALSEAIGRKHFAKTWHTVCEAMVMRLINRGWTKEAAFLHVVSSETARHWFQRHNKL